MRHADYAVDILDAHGSVIGHTLRRDIRKSIDIYHAVHILLVTPKGDVVLNTIPVRDDLPNLYAGLLGTTAATIRRSGESALQAASRCLGQELHLKNRVLRRVEERMVQLPDNHRTYISAFYVIANVPASYNTTDIGTLTIMTPHAINTDITIHPEKFAPTLRALWEVLYAALQTH